MSDPIPDTDLVRIAEREVLEAARKFAEVWKERIFGKEFFRTVDNLAAAVSLLESRERLLREGKS